MDWIAVFWTNNKDVIAGQIRHLITLAAGFLVAKGALQSDQSGAFINMGVGFVMWAIPAVWSWWQKEGQKKVLAAIAKAHNVVPKSTPTADAAKAVADTVVKVLIAAFALSLFLAGNPAQAQGKKSTVTAPISGNALPCDPANLLPGCQTPKTTDASGKLIVSLLSKPMQDLANFIAAGFDDAVSLSVAVPELQDGNGQACWSMMKNYSGVLKQHPIPLTLHAAADLEAIRLLNMAANKICQNAACTQVFTDAGNLVNAAMPTGMPLPNLTAICSKVPEIAIVTPTLPIVPLPSPSPTPSASPTP